MNKRPVVWLQSLLYIAAGINHFWHPAMYERIIPPYLPSPSLLNLASGIIEIVLGTLLLFQATKRFAAYAIIAMLVAFVPAHIYLIRLSHCSTPGFCWPWFLAWIRLLPGQLLLMWWAYRASKA